MSAEIEKKLMIRQARIDELEDIVTFYGEVIEQQKSKEYGVKWSLDVYPTRQDLASALEAGEMHVGTLGGRIACAAKMTGNSEIYNDISWPTEVPEEDVSVIHLLAVHGDFSGMGFAKELVAYFADLSRKLNRKVIRLDVLKENLPAERLYLKCGFRFVAEKKIFYEDTGLVDFRMFELVL